MPRRPRKNGVLRLEVTCGSLIVAAIRGSICGTCGDCWWGSTNLPRSTKHADIQFSARVSLCTVSELRCNELGISETARLCTTGRRRDTAGRKVVPRDEGLQPRQRIGRFSRYSTACEWPTCRTAWIRPAWPNVGLVSADIGPLWRDTEHFTHRIVGIAVTARYVPIQRTADRTARRPRNSTAGWATSTIRNRRSRSCRCCARERAGDRGR